MAGSNLFLIIFFVLLAFVLIIFGGDFFINSAVWIAKKTKIPALIIGATVVSIGTTLPEIFVSLTAAAKGYSDVAAGNASGSMLSNLALVLGLSILLKPAKGIEKRGYLQKFVLLLALCAALIGFVADGRIALWESVLLLVFFALFIGLEIFGAVKEMRRNRETPNAPLDASLAFFPFSIPFAQWQPVFFKETPMANSIPKTMQAAFLPGDSLLFLAGAAAIGVGANLMVDNVVVLCGSYLHIPPAVVSCTVVAFGTSLPELITMIKATRKNEAALSYGNIIGANFINGSLIFGMSGVITGAGGLIADDRFALFFAFGLVALFTLGLTLSVMLKAKTYRAMGAVMVASYLAYCVLMAVKVSFPVF